MTVISVPEVPYDQTAVRPDWADLPPELRSAITARIGAPVTWATTASGGFTRGFAAVLDTATGQRLFVKAASLIDQRHLSDWYAREAAATGALPAAVPAARPRWTLTAAGYYVVCLDAVDGRVPALPWAAEDLRAALTAWAVSAEALRYPPAELTSLGLPMLSDLLRSDLAWWAEIGAGHEAMPPVPTWAAARLPELTALESLAPKHAESDRVIHGDLRLDNVLIDAEGRAWICDWTWLCYGPAWFDTATLLVTAFASGLDADALFADHPTAADVPAEALDAVLAALAGYWLTRAQAGPTGASPHTRAHQRWSGEMALRWLATRQSWL